MDNWTGMIISLTFFLPIMLGVLYPFVGRRHLKRLNNILATSLTFCCLFICLIGKTDFDSGLIFLNETITFSFSSTPNTIFLIAIILLWLMIVRRGQSTTQKHPRFHGVLLCIAISFGFIAFFSGQFMIRYIALEIVGLMVALSAFEPFSDRESFSRFGGIFLILRLGDIGLWISILILQKHANTLEISQMINTATELPLQINTWVLAGFLLAILVKTAAYPFGIWRDFIEMDKSGPAFWLSSVLMPALGLYLLYRILPIIQSHFIFSRFLGFSTVILSIGMMIAHMLKWLHTDRNSLFSSLTTGMAIYLSAFTTSKALGIYLLCILLLQIIMIFEPVTQAKWAQLFKTLMLLSLNTVFSFLFLQNQPRPVLAGWVLITGFTFSWSWLSYIQILKTSSNVLSAQNDVHQRQALLEVRNAVYLLEQVGTNFQKGMTWFSQCFESNLLNQCFPFISSCLSKTARFIRSKIEKSLDSLWVKSVTFVDSTSEIISKYLEKNLEKLWFFSQKSMVNVSEGTLAGVENNGSEKANSFIHKSLRVLNEQEIRIKNKSFRWDLIWIPLLLMIVIFFLLNT